MNFKIKSLYLKNFKCINECNLNFEEEAQVFFIQGKNGYGKSTILEAIALCLDDYKKGKTYESYVSWNLPENQVTEIKLTCEINDQLLNIQIIINKKGEIERKALYKDTEKKGTEVLGLLEELGIKDFSKIMFYLQGAPDITTLTPVQLSETLQKLFNYDLEEYAEKLDLTKLKAEKDRITKDLYTKKCATFQKQELNVLTCSKADYNIAKTKITELTEKFKEIEKVIAEKQDAISVKSDKNSELLRLSQQLNMFLADQERIKTYEKSLNEYSEKKEEYNKLYAEKEEAKNKSSEKLLLCQGEIARISNDITAVKNYSEYLELTSELKKLESEQIKEMPDFEKVFIETKEALRVLEAVEKGICPTCHQSTSNLCDLAEYDYLKKYTSLGKEETQKILQDAISEKDSLEKQQKDIDTKILICKNKLSEKSEISEISERLKKINIEDLTKELSERQQDEKNIEIEVKKANEEYFNAKSLVNNLSEPQRPAISIDEVKAKIAEILSKQETLNAEIAILSEKEKGIEADKATKEKLSIELTPFEDLVFAYEKVIEINAGIEKYNASLAESQKENEKAILELEKELDAIEKTIKVYEEANSIVLKELPSYLTTKTCKKLENEINEFLNIIFPELEVELKPERKGVAFVYGLKTNPKKIEIKMTSGFEKQLLSIAWKVALSKAYGISVIFLDEADGASSEENSEKLYKKLLCTGIFGQVFLISHKSSLYSSLSNEFTTILFHVSEKGYIEQV